MNMNMEKIIMKIAKLSQEWDQLHSDALYYISINDLDKALETIQAMRINHAQTIKLRQEVLVLRDLNNERKIDSSK